MEIITAQQAAELIKDDSTICTAVFGQAGWPHDIALAVEERFLKDGHPKNITHVHAAGAGNWGPKGEDHWVHEGLLTTFIGAHAGSSPNLFKELSANKIKAWNLPLGTMLQLYREMGRKGPGLYTKTGLGTFIDPRQLGGKLNQKAFDDPRQLVEVHTIDGEEWMFYKKLHFDYGLMRGSFADTDGNISNHQEALNLEMLAVAQATRACGGKVIVQVTELTEVGMIHPKMVKVPGIYVDYVVVDARPEEFMQTQGTQYNRAFNGEIRVPLGGVPPLPLDPIKVMSRRAAMEFKPGMKCNFAIGTPTFTPSILNEEGCGHLIKMISESGSIGGVPGSGKDFGCHWNIEASCDQGDHFSFFDGGGLDSGVFGLSEVDQYGNVNTSLLNGRIMGVGGFINVSTHSHKTLFIGTFTAGGNEAEVRDGKIVITQEGKYKKFVKDVVQLTYNGPNAIANGNKLIFITERCVLEQSEKGMVLREIAPGIDMQKDILDQMEFMPVIPKGGPKLMRPSILQEEWGELKDIMEGRIENESELDKLEF